MKAGKLIKVIRFNRLFFWAVGFLFVINLLFFALIKNAERKKIAELYSVYETMRKIRVPERKDTAKARAQEGKEDIRNFTEALPQRLMFPEIIKEIFEALSRHGLPATNMSYKPEAVDFQKLLKYTTSFTVSGKYASLKAFLADIQNSKTLFCIESISFTNQSKAEELVSLNLKIAIYLR
jgi:Tfp pilus assembly protein PilO